LFAKVLCFGSRSAQNLSKSLACAVAGEIMQLCADGLGELRMKLKRAAVAELKRQEREFKNRLARNQKQRKNYHKKLLIRGKLNPPCDSGTLDRGYEGMYIYMVKPKP